MVFCPANQVFSGSYPGSCLILLYNGLGLHLCATIQGAAAGAGGRNSSDAFTLLQVTLPDAAVLAGSGSIPYPAEKALLLG